MLRLRISSKDSFSKYNGIRAVEQKSAKTFCESSEAFAGMVGGGVADVMTLK